jgi:zinc protease
MSSFSFASTLPGPDDITRRQLPNGIIVLSRPNFNSPSVVLNGYISAGGLFDTDEKLGLADFTAAALMRGTFERNFQQIYDLLESAGARLGIGGGTHVTSFQGKSLAEDLPMLLDLLSEALRYPAFPVDQIERLRSQLLAGLAIRAQDTGELASLAFDQIVYANHPYRRPTDGYPETIQAIAAADLGAFHQQHYGPVGMVIAVVGAVEPEKAIDMVTDVFGDWDNPNQLSLPELPDITPLKTTSVQRITLSGKSQSDILMGAAGPSRKSPDYPPASLGNNVLGQFGMMGRIGKVVREQAGLAYYASSVLNGGVGPGPWYVSAGVAPENVDQAVGLIREEITRFVSEPVHLEELQDSQANYIGRLPLSMESNGGVAAALINLERYELGLDFYRRFADITRAVTPEQILEVSRRYLDPDRLGIGIAGPSGPI